MLAAYKYEKAMQKQAKAQADVEWKKKNANSKAADKKRLAEAVAEGRVAIHQYHYFNCTMGVTPLPSHAILRCAS